MTLDIGFIPVDRPGHSGSGSVRTSTLLIENFSKRFDLTVYVISYDSVDDRRLPATNRTKYVVRDNLNTLPHPLYNMLGTVSELSGKLAEHDLVHSYCSEYVPALAEVTAPTLVTLNSYRPVCPKGDLRYHNRRKCSGPSFGKCLSCVTVSSMKRNQGLYKELRTYYTSLCYQRLVRDTLDSKTDITRYHSLSPHLKEDYASLGFPMNAIRVIPHFFDERFYRPTAKADSPTTDSPKILVTGRLEEKKGVQVLLRALPKLLDRGYEPTVDVVGSGYYETKLRSIADQLGIEDLVNWRGYVEYQDLPSTYAEADVFVYPGLWDEPFGRVLLEAMASKVPILASDVGSVDFIIGNAGRTFKPGDSGLLATEFDRLMGEYETIQTKIDDELRRYEKEPIIEAFADLYTETIGAGT